MSQKTKGFVKYGVIIAIIAVMLGGCKKDDKPEEKPVTPPDETSSLLKPDIESTPMEIKETKMTERMLAAEANKPSEVARIASAAKDWNPVLNEYYGQLAPKMKMKDINDNSLSISGLKGKKTVIVKWSTMHKESKDMVITLAELQKQIGAENLAVIAISIEDPAILKQQVEKLKIPFTVVGRRGVVRMKDPYRQNIDTPVCFFIDKAGKIQLITQKVIPLDTLNSLIEAL
jgi:peroxiredoxin